MKQSTITFIINKKPYSLNASDTEAIRNMPDADRKQLITLLEVIQREAGSTTTVGQSAASTVNISSNSSTTSIGNSSERLRSGDADAIMAQLIMEDELNRKPPVTRHTIHKWMAVVAVTIILLILVL